MAGTDETSSTNRFGVWILLAAALLVAGIVAWRTLGGAPDAGEAETRTEGPPSIAQLRDRAERDRDDAAAWTDLGFALFNAREFGEAAEAYSVAVEADEGSAVLWSALGEARVMGSERDPMPAAALEAFRKAAALDPQDPRARYFLAVKRDLDGDHEGAIGDWLALLEDTPAGAPWERDLVRTIEQVGAINQIAVDSRLAAAQDGRAALPEGPAMTAGAVPGPTQEQVAAASQLSRTEQDDMVAGMVASLESKLAADPRNVDGWIMLMRSRMTLGEPDRAAKALDDAVSANPSSAARLQAEAARLGVPGAPR